MNCSEMNNALLPASVKTFLDTSVENTGLVINCKWYVNCLAYRYMVVILTTVSSFLFIEQHLSKYKFTPLLHTRKIKLILIIIKLVLFINK